MFDWGLIIEKSVLILIVFTITLVIAMYSTYGERKIAAFLQDRIGPNRAGPFGILQPLADGGKMFFKEEFIPTASERFLFIAGPGIAMFTALMTGAVIPWSIPFEAFGRTIVPQAADINIGILYVVGFLSIGVYGIMIGGWASNNKYSLFGAIRASSQMISYELAMGLSIIIVVMMTGSLSLKDIAASQSGLNWNVFYQPLAFLIFFVCALAECNRAPFDLPECETELIGGYHTEYSSMKLGFYLFAEYINMFISSAIISTLFFGGYNYPGMESLVASGSTTLAAVLGIVVLFAKIFFFIFVFMWIRWTLPRFRYDQLMHLGWKILIPLAIINMLVTSGFLLFFAK
ncbi:MAG: NADH-quinone oxidoreductase subunit NuoH [Saprospiraceae bacterium]|nr:NADH-quinone oxidoreductase subunit NuoH [Saprospiraceae bacterium]MBP7699848.1 NADH-quinone oxidoreductase subunit NuoH [Saprospiraceae bacterium]